MTNRSISTANLLERFRKGDSDAASQLVIVFYDVLRRMAAAQMRDERAGHTLQPTALVNELCIKLLKQKALPTPSTAIEERLQTEKDFLGLARYLMTQILIEYGRARSAARRQHNRTDFDHALTVASVSDDQRSDVLLALDTLEKRDPDLRRLVDLRFFCGYTIAETAALLKKGQTQVKMDWHLAKLWLEKELESPGSRVARIDD
jgi:RNA polymerase sigma factor (TIGR02999 family)